MGDRPNWLARRAERTPERLALVAGPTRLTYGGLFWAAAQVAARLRAAGAGPRTRVALWAENGAAFVVALGAIWLTGAVAVPMNTRLTDDEAAWQLGDASPTLICAAPPLAERAATLARGLGAAFLALEPSLWRQSAPSAAVQDFPDLEPAAVAAVVYTSGTSGRPKGALITYDNLWHSAAGQALTLGAAPDDRWLACLPLFHVSGLAMLTRAWLFGQAVVVHERFDPERVAQALQEEAITCVSLVPTAFGRLLDSGADASWARSLRLVLLGGGPASPSLCRRALDAGVPTAVTYGLTETASQAATLMPGELGAHIGSVGRPLFWNEIRIARPDQSTAAPGEVGEILVRGPTVTPGYLGRPGATAETVRDGFLHTGDLGHLDAEGYLYVADRREDLVVTGGENVYPAEVEAVLAEHPQVAEVAVVGLPDEQWGQVVAAAVVPKPGQRPSLDALRAFAASRLAAYKLPRRVRLVPALERTASGKLRRSGVRSAWLAEGGDGDAGAARD